MTVPDGIYDNPTTQARERYRDGKLVEWISASSLIAYSDDDQRLRREARVQWGTYPSPAEKDV